MTWEIDVPSVPFKKPKELEHLENLSMSQREAMDPQEKKDSVRAAAIGLAKAYFKSNGRSPEKCRAIVHSALSELGNAFGGKFGAVMIGLSEKAAEDATSEVFPLE